MEPMTSVVALVRPRPFTSSLSPETTDTAFASVAKRALVRVLRYFVHLAESIDFCRSARESAFEGPNLLRWALGKTTPVGSSMRLSIARNRIQFTKAGCHNTSDGARCC